MENNYVGYNYAGIVGGSNNTVNNIVYNDNMFFSNGTLNVKKMLNKNIHLVMLYGYDESSACIDAVTKRLDDAIAAQSYPLFVEITDLVDICSRMVYFNGGANEEVVTELINSVFTIACIPHNFKYKAKIVRVGYRYFFEMCPQE